MDSYPGRCPAAASRRIRTAVRNQIFRIAHFARRGRRPIDGTDGVHAASRAGACSALHHSIIRGRRRALMKYHLPSTIDASPDRASQDVPGGPVFCRRPYASICDEDSVRRNRPEGIVSGYDRRGRGFGLLRGEAHDKRIPVVVDCSRTAEFDKLRRKEVSYGFRRLPDLRKMEFLLQPADRLELPLRNFHPNHGSILSRYDSHALSDREYITSSVPVFVPVQSCGPDHGRLACIAPAHWQRVRRHGGRYASCRLR